MGEDILASRHSSVGLLGACWVDYSSVLIRGGPTERASLCPSQEGESPTFPQ